MKLLLAAAVLAASFAHSDPKVCAKCSEMKALEAEFNALNYFSQRDRETGSEKALKSIAMVEERVKSGKTSPEEFVALVTLVAAANPYDVETQNASILAALIDRNGARRDAFKQALEQVEESCRRKDLDYSVESYLCQFDQARHSKAKGKVKIQDTDPGACLKKPIFNIETCLNEHSSRKAVTAPVAIEKKSTPRSPSSNE